jgi:hypothetical protein
VNYIYIIPGTKTSEDQTCEHPKKLENALDDLHSYALHIAKPFRDQWEIGFLFLFQFVASTRSVGTTVLFSLSLRSATSLSVYTEQLVTASEPAAKWI